MPELGAIWPLLNQVTADTKREPLWPPLKLTENRKSPLKASVPNAYNWQRQACRDVYGGGPGLRPSGSHPAFGAFITTCMPPMS
mmetsp:Transcript_5623/g.9396  ORF Transcript_5623/g.9396 Transcript_5623/m.9396 type:complete len:84 (+) Transcript_5623:536-787(+)